MSRPTAWLQMVRAAKSEALVAVKMYNDPTLERSLEAFCVHMHMAWLYLLQAEFLKTGVEFRYPHPTIPGRFKKVDGEYSTWDLERCTIERWGDTEDPVKANLKFFIKLRNKIEHRYKSKDATLFAAIADKSQALLLNFEEELTSHFGKEHTLAEQLRFPVFIGTFTEPAERAMRRLNKSLPNDLKKFLADYETGIEDTILKDSRYSFKLKVQLNPAQRGDPDLAIQFVRVDELTAEDSKKLSDVGKTGTVIIKERNIPVSNDGLLKFTTVVQEVGESIPFEFNQSHLSEAIKTEAIKPATGSSHPERTRAEFCRYDKLNRNYGYTPAYVKHLAGILRTERGFRRLTGRAPKPVTKIVVEGTNDPLAESNA